MTNPTAMPTLEYAMPADVRERRRRVVLRLAAVGAIALAIAPCVDLAFAIYAVTNGMIENADLALIFHLLFASAGLLMVAAAVLAWRAARPGSPEATPWVQRLFVATFLFVVVTALLSLAVQLPDVNSPMEAIHRAVDQSRYFVLLMPLLLVSTRLSPRRWMQRALLLAAVTLIVGGTAGVMHLLSDAQLIEERRGIPSAEAIRLAIQRPAPIVGLWPLSGIVAGVVLLASLPAQNRVAIRTAVVAGLIFTLLITWANFWWFTGPNGMPWTLWIQASSVLEASDRIIGTALPLALLWWATSAKQLAEERPEDEALMSAEASQAVID